MSREPEILQDAVTRYSALISAELTIRDKCIEMPGGFFGRRMATKQLNSSTDRLVGLVKECISVLATFSSSSVNDLIPSLTTRGPSVSMAMYSKAHQLKRVSFYQLGGNHSFMNSNNFGIPSPPLGLTVSLPDNSQLPKSILSRKDSIVFMKESEHEQELLEVSNECDLAFDLFPAEIQSVAQCNGSKEEQEKIVLLESTVRMLEDQLLHVESQKTHLQETIKGHARTVASYDSHLHFLQCDHQEHMKVIRMESSKVSASHSSAVKEVGALQLRVDQLNAEIEVLESATLDHYIADDQMVHTIYSHSSKGNERQKSRHTRQGECETR